MTSSILKTAKPLFSLIATCHSCGGSVANKRKTKITFETERVFSRKIRIREPDRITRRWCSGCGARVGVVTAEQAAAIAGVGSLAIYRAVESGNLHFSEDTDGMLFICLESLLTKDEESNFQGPEAQDQL